MITGARCVVQDVAKHYGARVGLRGVSFSVGSGEIVGVAGPNGAGKSTLARLLLGFAKPDAGRVEIDGLDARANRASHGVGYLPEEALPEWRCSPRHLLMLREPVHTTPSETLPVVSHLGIEPLLDRPLSQLSKGQRRMAMLAYALAGRSSLIILDEPDSGLDPDALDRLQAGIAYAAGQGSTVFVLSHNLDELERGCSRFLFVFRGGVVADLSRDEVREDSARATYRRLSRGDAS